MSNSSSFTVENEQTTGVDMTVSPNSTGGVSSTNCSGGSPTQEQAIASNVQREIYKQLELLLLKKKVGEGKLIIKPGHLVVSTAQIERVSQMSPGNVNHNIENISNILVQISKNSLHSVIEVLIKMAEPYTEEVEQMQSNKNTRVDLPSFKDETVESDMESSVGTSSTNILQLSSPPPPPTSISTSTSSLSNSGSSISIASPNLNSTDGTGDSTTTTTPAASLVSPPLTSSQPIAITSRKQISEDTPLYYLLNVIYSVLKSHEIERTSTLDDKSSQLATLPQKVISFFFQMLQFYYSAPVRYKSASCLQSISLVSMDTITQIYVTKLQSGKSDDFYREYSSIQKSAKYLEFGFYRASQIEGTCQYFAKILIEMEKVSRAVFIQSMCYTIIKAFPKMFQNSSSITSQVPDYFWSNINKMYEIVLKWTKKSKLKFICIKALFAMVGCSPEFLSSKGADLLSILSSALKETSSRGLRKAYFECLVHYFSTIHSVFGQESKVAFYQQQLDMILPVIISKKAPSPIEAPVILDILLAMGRFSLSITVNKYLLSVISPSSASANTSSGNLNSQKITNDYPLETRAILFKMLYRLNIEFPEAIRYFDRTLWSCLDPLFIGYDGDVSPMKYILLLFPNFCSHENLKEIADKITKWTWHSDQDIASMSTLGITKYLVNQPHTTFPSILLQMLTFISNYSADLMGLCKVIKNMSMVIQEFINLHYHSNGERSSLNSNTSIDPTTWRNLRETGDGISIYLLASNLPAIWTEVFSFIQLTGHEIFREIDQSLGKPYLYDYLHSGGSSSEIHPNQQSISTLVPSFNLELANFIQSAEINLFPSAVSWAWARLRKRWHPKLQAITWKNHLAFLLLSLRLNSDQPELSSVEEQVLVELLNQYFQERDGKTNEEIGQFIYEISLFVHPSSYDCIFRFMEQERGRDLKRKKKETFYTQDYVIIYASQLVDKISVSDYDNISSIRSAIREMTYFWITNPQFFKELSVNSRNHISRILKNFLALDGSSTIPKSEISLEKSSYTKLFFQSLQQLLPEYQLSMIRDDILFELEQNIQKSIQTLITVGNLEDFKKDIGPFLIKCISIGLHIHSLISETLAVFLRRSPKYLNEYVNSSFDNEKSPIASLLFLRALALNFSSEYYSKWSHNCPPERLIMLILFHMVSPNEEARSLAIQLSNDLSQRSPTTDEVSPLSPHFVVIQTKSLPLHIYQRSSLLYSNSMSSKYPWITPGLIDEINLSFKIFPYTHKQLILLLLAPWTRNFYWVSNEGGNSPHITSGDSGDLVEYPILFLESLFKLTLQAKLSASSNLSSCEVLWGELISSADAHGQDSMSFIVNTVVNFLRSKYANVEPMTQEQEKELAYNNQDIKDTCKMILTFVSRRSNVHWTLIAIHMMESLRQYPAILSSPGQLIQEYIDNQNNGNAENNAKYSNSTEETILSFFEDFAFEFKQKDVNQVPNLIPLLLCNIIYVYGPWTSPIAKSSICKKILNNILLSIVIQQTDIEASVKEEAYSLIQSDWSRWKEKQIRSLIQTIQTGLGTQCIELWETVSLQFAIYSQDSAISMVSLSWYSAIRSVLNSRREGMEGLLGLTCLLWNSTMLNDLEKSFRVLNLFIDMIDDQQSNHKLSLFSETSYAIIIRVASILLHTSYLQQFNGVLILLYKCIQSLQGSPVQTKIIEEMVDILSAGMTPDKVVSRGIAHPQTSLLSLWFAKEVSNFWFKQKNYQSSSILVSLILSASTLVTMNPDDSTTREFIEYLFEASSNTPILSSLLPSIQSYYHFNVAKTPGSLPPPPIRDLARSLVKQIYDCFSTSAEISSDILKSCNEMIRSLVDVGREESVSFLLIFINEMINKNHPSLSSGVNANTLIEFVQLIVEISQRSNSKATREEAQKTIPFILANLPSGLSLGTFDFLKPYNSSTGMSNQSNSIKINCLFGLHTERDTIQNAYQSLYLINTYLYAIPTDSSTNSQMNSILESKIKNTTFNNSSNKSKSTFSFIFSFKKKSEIPKPSQILYQSNGSPTNSTTNSPAISKLNRQSELISKPINPPSPSSRASIMMPPPIIPPKRSKPKSDQSQINITSDNDLPPPPQ